MARGKKGPERTITISDKQATALMKDADPRLSPGAARMNGLMARVFGHATPAPLSDDNIVFLNEFDKHMRAVAKKAGIELRDDD